MNKKAQEEIVGFIVIIVIMSVVALIFLAFSLRGPGNEIRDSTEARHLLESVLEYTSDCAIGYVPAYERVSGLIRECNTNSANKCVDGREACLVVNNTLKEIFESGLSFGQNQPLSGYKFEASYIIENKSSEITHLSYGNCSGGIFGAEYPLPANPGRINNRLELCFN